MAKPTGRLSLARHSKSERASFIGSNVRVVRGREQTVGPLIDRNRFSPSRASRLASRREPNVRTKFARPEQPGNFVPDVALDTSHVHDARHSNLIMQILDWFGATAGQAGYILSSVSPKAKVPTQYQDVVLSRFNKGPKKSSLARNNKRMVGPAPKRSKSAGKGLLSTLRR
jgi:hypothetical protein